MNKKVLIIVVILVIVIIFGVFFMSYFKTSVLPDETKAKVAMYAPLDGMNEKGLCVAVNMIQDSDTINQSSNKLDITTTTAARLLLNKAATDGRYGGAIAVEDNPVLEGWGNKIISINYAN